MLAQIILMHILRLELTCPLLALGMKSGPVFCFPWERYALSWPLSSLARRSNFFI